MNFILSNDDFLVRTDGPGLICDSANAKIFRRNCTFLICGWINDWGFVVRTPLGLSIKSPTQNLEITLEPTPTLSLTFVILATV